MERQAKQLFRLNTLLGGALEHSSEPWPRQRRLSNGIHSIDVECSWYGGPVDIAKHRTTWSVFTLTLAHTDNRICWETATGQLYKRLCRWFYFDHAMALALPSA